MIRKAISADIEGLYKLIRLASEHGNLLLRDRDDLRECLDEFWVEEVNGEVVACCALAVYNAKLAEIRSMAVLPEYQGKGLASELLQKCLEVAQEKGVYEVLTITNRPNIFEKKGFGVQLDEQRALVYRPNGTKSSIINELK